MSSNDFFAELGTEWKQARTLDLNQPSLVQALRSQRRQLWAQRLQQALALLSLVTALFFFLQPPAPVTLAAGAILLCAVLIEYWYLRRYRQPVTQWNDWSPEGLLRYRERLLQAQVHGAILVFVSTAVLLAFTAGLWVIAHFDATFAATNFHKLFTACAVPVAAVCSVIFGSSLPRNRKQLQHIRSMIADFAKNDSLV